MDGELLYMTLKKKFLFFFFSNPNIIFSSF